MSEKTALQIALEAAEKRKGEPLTAAEEGLIEEEMIEMGTSARCTRCDHIKQNVSTARSTYHCPGCNKFTSVSKAVAYYLETQQTDPEPAVKKKVSKKKATKKKTKAVKKKKTALEENVKELANKLAKNETGKTTKKKPAKKPVKKKAVQPVRVIEKNKIEPDQVIFVSPKKIKVKEGFNKRFDYGDMKSMEYSAEKRGIRLPVIARVNKDGDLELVAGERRHRAALRSFEKDPKGPCAKIPVFVRKYTSESGALSDLLIDNDHKAMNPFEQAAVVGVLRNDYKMTIADIADMLGKRQTWVKQRLALLEAGEKMQEAMMDGKLPLASAFEILKETKGDEEKQDKMVVRYKLTRSLGRKKLKQRTVGGKQGRYTPQKMRRLLAELATSFTRFERSGGPAKDSNDDWSDLASVLDEIRIAKREGRLSF